jgi:hypothetical protein
MGTFMRLRRLTEGGVDPAQGMAALAQRLQDLGEQGVLQVRLVGADAGDESRFWSIIAGEDSARAERVGRPDLEIVTTAETWRRLTDGSYSPLDAFLDGKLRVRGDVDFGKRVLRHLGEPGGSVDVC